MIMMTSNSYAKSLTKISLEQASEKIRKQSKGKVLSARTTRTINGEKIHKIKIITPDGRIKMHTINAGKPIKNNHFSGNSPNRINSFRSPNQSNFNNTNTNTTPATSTTSKKQ
jgi:hypothetical protein